jgi:secondary thiamine-phosphate synthase enzyme
VSKTIELKITSERRNQMIDITSQIQRLVTEQGIKDGSIQIFIPHTTAAVTINENADPTVQSDMLAFLEKLIPQNSGFRHSEGNSDSHIKSSLVGSHQAVFISNGRLVLGIWQGIYFCEFDGPRSRLAIVKIFED